MTNYKLKTLIIIPAYNESQNIIKVIKSLWETCPEWDLVIINDCSQDNTNELADAATSEVSIFENHGRGYVINLVNNLGIGGGVQTGFKFAKKYGYDIAVQFDGDGQHIATEISKLIEPIKKNMADIVIGSRFIQKHKGFKSTLARRFGIKLFEIINSLLINQKITDNTSGFRAYNKRAIEFLAKYYPTDYPEPEAVILLGKNGFSLKEVSTVMQERQGGVSSISGFKSIYYMIKVVLAIFMTSLRSRLK